MFSAHLVFGDIDKHSNLAFASRRQQLENFWSICEDHCPKEIADSRYSFYDIDNDCIMAGFSDVSNYRDGITILKWVLALQEDLSQHEVRASFGVNLIACGNVIEWETCPNFVDTPGQLYIPDRIYLKYGRVQRSRLAGDGLILVSRLLELAKKVELKIAFSTFNGGHLPGAVSSILDDEQLKGKISLHEISEHFHLLDPGKEAWLRERGINAWGIT